MEYGSAPSNRQISNYGDSFEEYQCLDKAEILTVIPPPMEQLPEVSDKTMSPKINPSGLALPRDSIRTSNKTETPNLKPIYIDIDLYKNLQENMDKFDHYPSKQLIVAR